MKTWKTITITALATLGLTTGGLFFYTSNQPSHYKSETFKNEKVASSSSTSSSSSSTSTSTTQESASVQSSETQESTPAEVAQTETQDATPVEATETQNPNDPYNLVGSYVNGDYRVVEYVNEYYIVAKSIPTNYGSKSMYFIYDPEHQILDEKDCTDSLSQIENYLGKW